MRSPTTTCLLLLISSLVVACQPHPSGGGADSDDEALRTRIDALFIAEQAEDWRAWYDLTAQAQQGLSTYEEFLAEMGGGKKRAFTIVSWKVLSIDPVELKEEEAAFAAIKMKVPMDVEVRRADGATKKVRDHTDYWYRIDGRWYWGWRGYPYD